MSYRVLQLTDFHVFANPGAKLKGIPTRELLVDVVDYILSNEAPFDAVIVTGDHTHDELPKSYAAVQEILSPWQDRLWQIPGNHDDRSVLRQVFADRISGTEQDAIRFQFELGDWALYGLDSHVPGEVPGRVGAEQMEWLRSELAATKAAAVALFIHHPPVDVGSGWMDDIGLHDRELLHDVVASEQRIRLICCGHVHHEFLGQLEQAVVHTTPSTGIQFDPEGNVPHFSASPAGYRVIEFNADEFTTHVVRLPEVKYVPENG